MKKEIHDFFFEIDQDKPTDVNAIQAMLIIREVLDALEVDFNELNIKRKLKYIFEGSKEDSKFEFPRGKPDYWYAEADIPNKRVEVVIDDYSVRIPLTTILYWFSKEEKEDRR